MRFYHVRVLILTILLVFIASVCFATQFPYRKNYPGVPTISTQELKKDFDQENVVIVDVRSEIEYNVIHPKNAVHIPLSNKDFVSRIKKLVKENPEKKIVCYCNGVTCLKSYEAVRKAKDAGLSNLYAFDAGVFDWAKKYPEQTLLLGDEITNPRRQLIPREIFQKQCVDYATFKKKARESDHVVIDARSDIQRTKELPGLEDVQVLTMPPDKLINNIIKKRRMKDKVLLIFDQVGKQTRWIMYYLAEERYTDYYFLRGGANAVLEKQKYR